MISAFSLFRLGRLMQEFLPHILVNDAGTLHLVAEFAERKAQTISMRVLQPGEPVVVPHDDELRAVPPQIRDSIKPWLPNLFDECKKLRLKASCATLGRMLASLDKPETPLRNLADDALELHGRMVDELKEMSCFALEGDAERLYRADHLFGKEVADRFPATSVDIEESGRCLALDRATACVFHLMRVLEVGLQALATDLGIAKLERNWQLLLQETDAQIRALPFKTDQEKERLAQRSAAVAHLRNVKDAWRNDVMHPRDVYTVEQAQDIFNHTRALMGSLAAFL